MNPIARVDPGRATATESCPGVSVAGARRDDQPLSALSRVGVTITWTTVRSCRPNGDTHDEPARPLRPSHRGQSMAGESGDATTDLRASEAPVSRAKAIACSRDIACPASHAAAAAVSPRLSRALL